MNEQVYQKKILPYLDGTLSQSERVEFEAYLRAHPAFESQVKSKEEQLERIKARIPAAMLTQESRESLEGELKLSIQHLLKDDSKDGLLVSVRDWIDNRFSR